MNQFGGRLRARNRRHDLGFTLVELIVSMIVLLVIMASVGAIVVSASSAAATTRELHDVNEEARQAINRMARDLRQATSIISVVNPDGMSFSSSSVVALRFTADYNGDGCINGKTAVLGCAAEDLSNPEDLSYCFDPTNSQLYVVDNNSVATPVGAGNPTCTGGLPLLAGHVASLQFFYRSNNYLYDANSDGVTTWLELDAAGPPVGDGNGRLDAELSSIDSVVIKLTMRVDGHSQSYETQVSLRNALH